MAFTRNVRKVATSLGDGGSSGNAAGGVAKAWFFLDQDTQAMANSFNIGATIDDGAGTNTYKFVHHMRSAIYSSVGAAHDTGAYWALDPYPGDWDAGTHTTQGSVVQVAHHNSATGQPAVADLNVVNVIVFGDLA